MTRLTLDRLIVAGMAAFAILVAASPHACAAPAPRMQAQPAAAASQPTKPARPVAHQRAGVDRTGRRRVGKASIYAAKFSGRKMADGTRMDPQSDSAASKTLPLGTVAQVTNLQTGQSAVVTVRDRGPHVPGRIVDLSPSSAREVGIDHREGVARVAVTPISLPQPGDTASARQKR